MNPRHFERKSEAYLSVTEGQLSLFDSFNAVKYLKPDPAKEPELEEVIVSSYRRSKTK